MAAREERLSEDLVLRHVQGEDDIKRFAAFLSTINLVEGMTADCLLRGHPGTRREEFLMIQDSGTGEMASSSCIIPWQMRYAGAELSCIQLEMFLTNPRYRKRGLVRAQFKRLHELADERKSDVVIIWGIPYYYRQFGYGYSMDGLAFQSLPAYRIEEGRTATEAGYVLREARPDDIPSLCSLHGRAMAGLDVALERPAEHWKYLLGAARFPVHVLQEGKSGTVAGYSIHARFKKLVHIFESGIEDQDLALAFLRELKRGADEIQINWPRTQTLVKLSESLGSIPVKSTQWLIRIPDVRGLLEKIRPVLDRRLASSAFARASRDFVLNLFKEGLRIRIRDGRVSAVEPAGFVDASMGADGGNLNIPPEAFTRLLFGQSSLDALFDAWPDIVCRPEDRGLVDTLFPRMASYLYTPYHYYGPEMFTLEEKYLKFYV